MRSRGGGVGAPQTIPLGKVAEFEGVGVGAGVGTPTTTTGGRTGVGVAGSDPHEVSARPVAAQTIENASLPGILVSYSFN